MAPEPDINQKKKGKEKEDDATLIDEFEDNPPSRTQKLLKDAVKPSTSPSGRRRTIAIKGKQTRDPEKESHFKRVSHERMKLFRVELTEEKVKFFKNNEKLKSEAENAFLSILSLYGLAYRNDEIVHEAKWNKNKDYWIYPESRSYQDISQILSFLTQVGMRDEAKAFYLFLKDLTMRERGKIPHMAEAAWDAIMSSKYKI